MFWLQLLLLYQKKRNTTNDNSGDGKNISYLNNIEGNNNITGNNNKITYVNTIKDDSKIEIVDVDFVVENNGYFIDIKIRNTGDKVAFLKKITFNIYDSFAMKNPQITQYKLIKSTATYDVVLNDDKQQQFSLSQSVAADDVDRFRIKVASAIAETRMVTIYHFSFDIYYDEDNKTVKSQNYVADFPSTSEWAGCYISHTSMEIAKLNYLKLLQFSNLDCKKSNTFEKIYNSYEKSKNDFM